MAWSAPETHPRLCWRPASAKNLRHQYEHRHVLDPLNQGVEQPIVAKPDATPKRKAPKTG